MLCRSNWCAPRIAVCRVAQCDVPRRALRCAASRIAVRRVAHCGTPYVHGQLWEKNGWQISNPRIDTGERGEGRERQRDRQRQRGGSRE